MPRLACVFSSGRLPGHIKAAAGSGSGGLPIELCVKKQAADTAALYGLHDRGTLEVGKLADVNVVDMAALQILAPVHVRKRALQSICCVIVQLRRLFLPYRCLISHSFCHHDSDYHNRVLS